MQVNGTVQEVLKSQGSTAAIKFLKDFNDGSFFCEDPFLFCSAIFH